MPTGRCLCGGVSFALMGALRPSVACHCGQCRKTSGHYWSATQVATQDLNMLSDATLTWFRSSDHAQRGFCNACGSSLFWKMDGEESVSVGTGTIDGATGLTTQMHIFVADKGDYYDIETGPEQLAKY